MFHKSAEYRIHQRERIIHKRIQDIKDSWGLRLSDFANDRRFPGRYDKTHLGCSCWMCSKSMKTKYAGNKYTELRKLEGDKDE